MDDSVLFISFSLSPAEFKAKLFVFYLLLPDYLDKYLLGDKFVYELNFGGEFSSFHNYFGGELSSLITIVGFI